MEKEILIKTEGLKKYFPVKKLLGGKKQFVKAVDGINLEILKGETFGLVGESGCGKSTLGRTIIGMYESSEGKIFYKNKDITGKNAVAKNNLRNKMQIIFQDPYSSLNPYWNVEEILNEPLKEIKMEKGQRREKIEFLMEKVGLNKNDLKKFPYEFSGGQRQRIGIARAISVNPEFIMCDEPIAALDVSIQAQVVNMLEDIQRELGLTYIFAAHDLSMVKYISTRIGVMYLGKIVEITSSNELYKNPLHPYTKALLSAIPIADPIKAKENKRIRLMGELPSPINVPKGCRFANRCPFKTDKCIEESPKLMEVEKNHFVACHRALEIQ